MKLLSIFLVVVLLLTGCSVRSAPAQIAVTTLPVYDFTISLCEGTDLTVERLINENVSCLHDYTLKVDQMRIIESAQLLIISGSGLEDFLEGALTSAKVTVDASEDLQSLHREHEHHHADGHSHAEDPHVWLSPENAKIMAENICNALSQQYPNYSPIFERNLRSLLQDLDALQSYGEETLSNLSCRELITFHDGFAYFAESFDLTILKSLEEESGSEASASELIELIHLIDEHNIPAIFTEINGSVSAAGIISAETGIKTYSLDMCMATDNYFSAMYRNINTIKEALQ